MKNKKIIIFMLILLIAVSVSACKSRGGENEEEKIKGARDLTELSEPSKPESRAESAPPPESRPAEGNNAEVRDKADAFLKAAKTGERVQIQSFVDYNTLFGLEEGQDADWILQQVLMRMKYEILSVEMETGGDKATVSAKFSNIDMNVVLPLYFQEAMELEYNNALSDTPMDASEMEKEYHRIFAGVASKYAEGRIERLVDIELVKKDEDWSIQPERKLGDAMLGEYLSARGNITLSDYMPPEISSSSQEEADMFGNIEDDLNYDIDEFSMVPPRE